MLYDPKWEVPAIKTGMDAALKAQWVEALRNEKYAQGSGFLKKGSAFCCLGVLCDIQNGEWASIERQLGGLYTERLPKHLNAGLTNDQCAELAQMNDNGARFPEIADHIEKNL